MATRNSFHAPMKVKISAVTMPGAASGSGIPAGADWPEAVDHGRLPQRPDREKGR
jgi:hypothetical protein